MARDFNQIRNTNAKLGEVNITRYGKTWAVQYGFDGANVINNEVPPVPTDIKEYLEGNDNITIFACASNIDKLCEYALASFPNIEDLYLFKTSAIVVLEDDLSYLLDLNKIYVPTDLLSAYISAYPTLSTKFDTIVEDYTLTIPFVGDTTLTSEYVDSVIAMLSNAEKNAITKVVIPTDFSSSSATAIAWGYDFSAIVNLNNNIWYGATKYDFSVWTIEGSGILTSEIVESSIASIPSDKLSGITKIVVPNTFTNFNDLVMNVVDNYFTNNIELEWGISNSYISVESWLSPRIYDWSRSNTIIDTLIYTPTIVRRIFLRNNSGLKTLIALNLSSTAGIDNVDGLENYIFNQELSYRAKIGSDYYSKNQMNYSSYYFQRFSKAYAPNATNVSLGTFDYSTNAKAYVGDKIISTNVTMFYRMTNSKLYCHATILSTYISNGLEDKNYFVGVLDGENKYNNIPYGYKDYQYNLSMNYPKLSSTLTIDTANGHLMDNGVDLFDGYTATWYSNENCTTTIQPSDITSDMTVYVKLSAI